MSATETSSEIQKLPQRRRKKVFQSVDAELRRSEDLFDNAAADRALAGAGKNIPWSEARKKLGWA